MCEITHSWGKPRIPPEGFKARTSDMDAITYSKQMPFRFSDLPGLNGMGFAMNKIQKIQKRCLRKWVGEEDGLLKSSPQEKEVMI